MPGGIQRFSIQVEAAVFMRFIGRLVSATENSVYCIREDANYVRETNEVIVSADSVLRQDDPLERDQLC